MLAVVAAAGDSPSTLAAVPQPFMAADAQHEAAGRFVCLLALFFSGGRSTAGLRSKKPVGCGVIKVVHVGEESRKWSDGWATRSCSRSK